MVSSSQADRKVVGDGKPLAPTAEPFVARADTTLSTTKLKNETSACRKCHHTTPYVQNHEPAVEHHMLEHPAGSSACASLCRESKPQAGKKKRSPSPSTRPGNLATSGERRAIMFEGLTAGAGRVGHVCACRPASHRKTKSGPAWLRSRAMF